MDQSKKILILGANGMVGGTIKKKLLEREFTNILIPSKSELDLVNQNEVIEYFKKNSPDIVFMAAARVGGIGASSKFQSIFLYENLQMQNNVISAAAFNNVERFIFFSSSCMYPKEWKRPFVEDDIFTGKFEETCDGYALAKSAGTMLCDKFYEQNGLNTVTVVPCNLFGPGDDFDLKTSHVLSALVRKIYEAKLNDLKTVSMWGTGNACREFMYVEDLAEISIKIASDYKLNGIINIGSGEDISISDLANLIKDLINYKGDFAWDINKPDGVLRKVMNVEKMKNKGLKARHSFKEAIIKHIQYYKLNRNHIIKTKSNRNDIFENNLTMMNKN